MSVLWVRTGYENAFFRSVQSYERRMEEIKGNYETAQHRLAPLTSDSLIYSCNTYVKRRAHAMDQKISAAQSLKRRAKTYTEHVIQVDQEIKSLIHKQSYSFYKKTGIGPQEDSVWARFTYGLQINAQDFLHDAAGTAARLCDEIKGFLEEHKYIVNVVKDVAALVGTVLLIPLASATGFIGIICLIGFTYSVMSATYKTLTDIKALEAHYSGEEGEAEYWAGKKLSTSMVDSGEWLDQKLGFTFFEPIMKCTAITFETAAFVCDVVLILNGIKSCFNLNIKSLDLRNPTSRSFKQSLVYAKNTQWFRSDRLINPKNWVDFLAKGYIDKLKSSGTALGTEIADIILA